MSDMKVDLFDFDGTVINGDSGIRFWRYCVSRHPRILIYFPVQAWGVICYALHIGDRTLAKERLFRYFLGIDAEKLAHDFWAENEYRLHDFFLPKNRELPVVVASASPYFFLKIICDKLGVYHLVATCNDPKTGKINGLNCHDTEKVRRLREELPGAEYENVYSDSVASDAPILALGRNAFIVKKGKTINYHRADKGDLK